jgi:release factor glutamine methyltransferase
MTTEQPWTIRRLLEWTTKRLQPLAGDSASLEASVLLAHALNCRRIDLYMRSDDEAADEERSRYRELVRRRVEGCPVAYLVGRKEFYSLDFEVDPSVLIPRADTEWLVEECLRLAKDIADLTILEVGSGSGCIAISLASRLKEAKITATDISTAALAVAGRNARKHNLAERIRFLEGDLYSAVSEGEQFDIVVSNPPYIATAEIDTLEPGVKDHEPRLALDGGPDGFVIIDRLLAGANARVKPGGYLILEIGSGQEAAARARFAALTEFELAETLRDGGGHARVLRARRRGYP